MSVQARVAIRVQPRSSTNRVGGRIGEEWKIHITAPPVDGKANQACIDFLARELKVPRSAIRIVAGQTSRHKRIEVDGITQEELDQFLQEAV